LHNSIRPNEPVGYFEFEGEAKEVLFYLDVIRPCKYIMLKPTNFRKTPHDHTAHFSMNAIEIKYFAAYGTQIPKVEGDSWALGTVSDC
jgi:ubiquitin-activating enzyme E1